MSSAAKRSSAVGGGDQFDMDQSAEVELQKLQRQVCSHSTGRLSIGMVDGVMTKCQEECWGNRPFQLAMIIIVTESPLPVRDDIH